MRRIRLNYVLGADTGSAPLHNPLLDLLQAVREQGSISAAARVLDLSYRHVWGELKRWELELGQPLILWEKGQAARLAQFLERGADFGRRLRGAGGGHEIACLV